MADARTVNLLGALALALTDDMQAAARHVAGLGSSACTVLVTLGPYPGTTIGTVARVLGLTHSVAVRLVDDLVQAGLVERAAGLDRRQVTLRLSDEGVRRRAAIVAARQGALDAALGALDAGARRELEPLLDKMLVSLTRSRERADHICRLCDEFVCTPATCPVEHEALRLAGSTP